MVKGGLRRQALTTGAPLGPPGCTSTMRGPDYGPTPLVGSNSTQPHTCKNHYCALLWIGHSVQNFSNYKFTNQVTSPSCLASTVSMVRI